MVSDMQRNMEESDEEQHIEHIEWRGYIILRLWCKIFEQHLSYLLVRKFFIMSFKNTIHFFNDTITSIIINMAALNIIFQ